ncbi:MAG: hypothetical protein IPO20_06020 [Gammaproteobacteria bacterium]|nr:hypothetical protein [Gammaproteobacteria bacterium]
MLAFDARTGKQLWSSTRCPRSPADPAAELGAGTGEGYGGGNVWSSMAVDQELDLVYLPTTSPSGDFYGGDRAGDNNYTTSVVALRGATGEVAWHFQVVHHNVFDFDVPSQPMLIDFPHNGAMVPALVQNTKMGLIFVFDRATGAPLVLIEERPVPRDVRVGAKCCRRPNRFPSACPRSDRWDSLPRTRGIHAGRQMAVSRKDRGAQLRDRSTRLPAKRERSSRHPSAAVPTGVAAPMTRRATSWWFRPIAYPWS